jgi:glycosyltransferase involved in cell wall biosynthesis
VGGTNPSLVEALGAGNAVIAHSNKFNRWVAQDGAIYFSGAEEFSSCITKFISDAQLAGQLKAASQARFQAAFTWPQVLAQYEQLLLQYQ